MPPLRVVVQRRGALRHVAAADGRPHALPLHLQVRAEVRGHAADLVQQREVRRVARGLLLDGGEQRVRGVLRRGECGAKKDDCLRERVVCEHAAPPAVEDDVLWLGVGRAAASAGVRAEPAHALQSRSDGGGEGGAVRRERLELCAEHREEDGLREKPRGEELRAADANQTLVEADERQVRRQPRHEERHAVYDGGVVHARAVVDAQVGRKQSDRRRHLGQRDRRGRGSWRRDKVDSQLA
mmetsp:Transcript_40758/g.101248  ORF Transcript_40758/g.101248 Transcript_40758/m.101248 type:complete len:240 (+) Transcript_40758:609-1328(+)